MQTPQPDEELGSLLGTQRRPVLADSEDELVVQLAGYFDGTSSLADVRGATATISRALYTGALPPQGLISLLDTSLHNAALRSGISIAAPEFRALHGELSIWLIETCFAGIDALP